MSWHDRESRALIARAVLALSNTRDGGVIVVGVSESTSDSFELVGLGDDESGSFTQDGVSSFVNEYADPPVSVSVTRCDVDGKAVVVIQVPEFEELPTVCRKDGPKGLKRGAVFTRPRRVRESASVANQTEMREILERAIDRGIRRQLERFGAAGLMAGLDLDANGKRVADPQVIEARRIARRAASHKKYEDERGGFG